MNESEKRLGQFGLATAVVVTVLGCRLDKDATTVAGWPSFTGSGTLAGCMLPDAVDPKNPTFILSQLAPDAYDSLFDDPSQNRHTIRPIVSPARHSGTNLSQQTCAIRGQYRVQIANDTVQPAAPDGTVYDALLQHRRSLHATRAIGDFVLTAYAVSPQDTGKWPGSPAYGITASGTTARVGRTVAVDPHVIPIGTVLWIQGLGYRIAEDTGGAVKGHHIDVLVKDDDVAVHFGVRWHVRVSTLRVNSRY